MMGKSNWLITSIIADSIEHQHFTALIAHVRLHNIKSCRSLINLLKLTQSFNNKIELRMNRAISETLIGKRTQIIVEFVLITLHHEFFINFSFKVKPAP